ncbi:MAG: radical SAM protein [Erysipelotrichaceae bacterium]|nr:MAG: radical SAM [Erysipelotrichaceae bacterium]TXT16525.1 MAG: radical SAM protein [Erysipelotrichaceae bacterium]
MPYQRIYIEITNVCNLNCSFCLPTQRKSQFMSVSEFEHILTEIKDHTQHIYLHIKGEPTLHPQLKQFMDLAAQVHLKVHLVSNGTLLDQLDFDLLVHPALAQLSISLHSVQNMNTEKRVSYLKSIENIIMRSKTFYFTLFLRVWNENNTEIIDWLSSILNTEIHYEPNKHRIKISKNITLDFDKVFTWPSLDHEFVGLAGSCYGGLKMMGFLVDGTVTPCCLDNEGDIALGNIHTTSFIDLIQSPRYLSFTSGLASIQLIEPLCQHCTYHLKHKKKRLG